MAHSWQVWLLCLGTLLVASSLPNSQARKKNENRVKSAVFLSPKFVLKPGSVVNKYYTIDFPRGHIGLKSFNAEVVDESGNPIPLHETYLHHWDIYRYYQLEGTVEVPQYNGNQLGFHQSDFIIVKNSGPCDLSHGQYFGLGSEIRRTATHVPDPYGIEVGNPAKIPPGYEEKWLLNVHAIDTRGVEDRLGCIECRCDLYNVTEDEYGQPLRPDYIGGLNCCYDQKQCRVREGFESVKRSLYMRYTVKWVDWDTSVLPVRIYIFDVTDTWKKLDNSTGLGTKHNCMIEYDVKSCSATAVTDDDCIDTKRVSLTMPTGGNLIYGVAHQHTGGIGSALYRKDGRVICSSIPTYGEGKEAGNETGYIVGMSTCYPHPPDSVQIFDGETLILESNYSAAQNHTGVMGLFYVLVADALPKRNSFLHALVKKHGQMTTQVPISQWGVVALLAMAIAMAVVLAANGRTSDKEHCYEEIYRNV